MASSVTPSERPRGRGAQQVFKSGPLYISSKGLGWKSWKRRWFVLTRTSLVFFKSDPNVASQKNELNLALGGIDLNNSGSVLVRADKKLLTVLFPDGRAFTLKAETSEDLNEWKASLEKALSTAPNAGLVMGQNGIFRNDSIDAGEGPVAEIGREKRPVKSLVVGRPILLALEDIDGSPSFLEKALCYIEQYGVKVEGILRQSADVDDVERRIRDFEQGKSEFGPEEDAHIVGDCIKHVLRELPSSPVPTPCCTALLEAYRIDGKGARIASMRIAVSETFPEPNRRLLQRLLKMMRTVAAHTAENRMTSSAVAACMAPLLLRPLLAGECGLEDDSDVSGDNSAQLLAAATAANNAQAIITLLMEEYDCIFDEEVQPTPASLAVYPQNEDSASDGSLDEEVLQMHDNGYHDARNDADPELDEDADCVLSCTLSESSGNDGSDIYDYKDVQVFEGGDSENESPERFNKGFTQSVNLGSSGKRGSAALLANENFLTTSLDMGRSPWCDVNSPLVSPKTGMSGFGRGAVVGKADPKSQSSASSVKRTPLWGRPSATKKNVSLDAMDSSEEELAIQRLEAMRNELRNKIAREAKGNAALQASLERRKQALHERRFTLEQDVTRLQEQLQAERDLRAALEIGLSMSSSQFLMTQSFDLKTRAELEEIARAEADVARLKQKVAELHMQLNGQRQHQHCSTVSETNDRFHWAKNLQAQQKVLQQELDVTLALCHHEKQKNHETDIRKGQEHSSTLADHHQRNALIEAKDVPKAEKARGIDMRRRNAQQDLSGVGWRALRPPTGPSAGGRQFAWKQRPDSSINMDPRQTDATMSYSTNDCTSVSDMVAHNSAKRSYMDVEASNPAMSMYPRQSAASLALVELTTRLDFFKERRSQLMEQLHNLDLTISPTSVDGHDLVYSSPPWNHQS